MKKFENLGKILTKNEQKKINGGYDTGCGTCTSQVDSCNKGCSCSGCPDIGWACSKNGGETVSQ